MDQKALHDALVSGVPFRKLVEANIQEALAAGAPLRSKPSVTQDTLKQLQQSKGAIDNVLARITAVPSGDSK